MLGPIEMDILCHTLYVDCDCTSFDHTVRLRWYVDDEDDWIYVDFHLKKKPFFQRLWSALLYVLGRRSRYGEFGELIMNKETALKLRDFMVDYAYRKDLEPMK